MEYLLAPLAILVGYMILELCWWTFTRFERRYSPMWRKIAVTILAGVTILYLSAAIFLPIMLDF